MQTRRDHVQAYRFATNRLSAALVGGDAGGRDIPLRRARLGLGFGSLLALLIALGVLVYGLVSPGGATSWREAGSVVLERETGNRYVLREGVLHPTLNFSSAMLAAAGLAEGRAPQVRSVTSASLGATPRGDMLGIVGAPDVVPEREALLTDWAVCAVPDAGPVLDLAPTTRPATALGNRRVLLAGAGGDLAVLWRGSVFAVPSRPIALALGLGGRPLPAPPPFLAALPTGPELAPAPMIGRGLPGPVVAGAPTVIGQVFRTDVAGGAQWYVLRVDGLAPTSATEAALWSSESGAGTAREVGPAELAALPVSADTSSTGRVPDLAGAPDLSPGASPDAGPVCARQTSGGAAGGVGLVTLPPLDPSDPPVLVPPGRGMYAVEAAPPGGEPRRWLVSERGVRHRLISDDAVTALGLGGVTPVQVPASALDAVPLGPALDPGRALRTVTTVPASPAVGDPTTGGGP